MPDGAVGDHEGFGNENLIAITRLDHGVDFRCLERHRLFAKHMLSGIGGLDGPFDMLRGRQRNIDGVDHIGCEHLFIGAEGVRHREAVGHLAGPGKIAAGNRRHDAVFSVLNGGNNEFAADLGRRQNTETQHGVSSPFGGTVSARYVPIKLSRRE